MCFGPFPAHARPENTYTIDFQFKNYQPQEYLANPQNWDIAQDNRGMMYFANTEGLLQYDGVSWRLFSLPGRGAVRSIDTDSAGTVYVGGVGCLGYMTPDESGRLKFVSLKESIDEKYHDFLEVWNTYISGKEILFRTKKYIFQISNPFYGGINKAKVWPAKTIFSKLFKVNDRFFTRQHNIGLMSFSADSLIIIPDGEKFAQTAVLAMLPYDKEKILIFTDRQGLFLYDGIEARRFPTEIDRRLKSAGIYKANVLTDGNYVISSFNKGLAIIDRNGRLRKILDKTNGLADNTVHALYIDRQRLLWAGLNNGISRIEVNSPWSFFDKKMGLEGIVNSIISHHDKIYAASTDGLFYSKNWSFRGTKQLTYAGPMRFKKIKGVGQECWDLLSIDKFLLTATSHGLAIKGENKHELLFKGQKTYYLKRSKSDSNRFWVGLKNGFGSIYYTNKTWIEEHRYSKIKGNVRSILESKNGSLWLSIENVGIMRVDLIQNGEVFPAVYHVKKFLPEQGFANIENNIIWQIAGREVFAFNDSIFFFDKNQQKFIPAPLFYTIPELKDRTIMNLREDMAGNVWIVSYAKKLASRGPKETQISVLKKQKDNTYIWQNAFLQRHRESYIFSIYADKNFIWFGGNEGLIRYNPKIKKDYSIDFLTNMRKVQINGDSTIYYGHKYYTRKKPFYPQIRYANNSIRFEYAASFYENEESTLYQYMLEGFDENWSAWSNEHKMYYPGLAEGDYIFHVRAKNVFNYVSKQADFSFKILAPWYRSWWAYIIYGTIFYFLILIIIKRRSAHLEKEKTRLEVIIAERTKQIQQASDELSSKNLQLLNQAEKLKEMDQIKSNFFTNISHEFRTPLTLILGPLQKMMGQKKSSVFKSDLQLMSKNAERLLTLINQLLDLSKLEYGKMQIKAKEENLNNFLKIIVDSFHSLAAENGTSLIFIEEQKNIRLHFDSEHLQKIMNNLLSNACKFTPPNGEIKVIVRRPKKNESVEIIVRDTGIGIDDEHLAHLFDRFYQVDSAQNRNYEGSGIGLALTKELVELHKGKIEVRSEPGKGTEFIVRLPFEKKYPEDEKFEEMNSPLKMARLAGVAAQGGRGLSDEMSRPIKNLPV